MKKVLYFTLVTLFLTLGTASAQVSIAIIDLERAMNESEAGKKANVALQKELEAAQARGVRIAKEVETISKEIETQRGVLTQAALQKKVADVQKKKVELERLEKDTGDELQRKQMQLVSGIVVEMKKIIDAYAKEKKLDLILEAKEAGAAYVNPKLDITTEIIKRYNAVWKKKK